MNQMHDKRKLILLMLSVSAVLAVFLLSVWTFYGKNKFGTQPSETSNGNGSYLSDDAMEQILSNRSDRIICVVEELCSSCQAMLSHLDNAKQELGVSYDRISVDSESIRNIMGEYDIHISPALIVIKNGHISIYQGVLPALQVMSLFRSFRDDFCYYDRLENIQPISYEDLQEKCADDCDFFLYIGRPDCPDCQQFYPKLENYISNHQYSGVYYLDIKRYRDAAIGESATTESKEFYETLRTMYEVTWVPCIRHIRNGEIIGKYQYLTADYYDLDATGKAEMENEYQNMLGDWFLQQW